MGVEHLLRDINDHSVSTLAEKVRDQITALNGLKSRLLEMSKYIDDAASGALVPNNQVGPRRADGWPGRIWQKPTRRGRHSLAALLAICCSKQTPPSRCSLCVSLFETEAFFCM